MTTEKEMLTELQRYYTLWKDSNVVYEEWAKSHDLSMNSLLILYSFHEDLDDGSCTQKKISQKWNIPKQTVNTILKQFEAQEYIEFTSTQEDRRNKQICLTPKGKKFTESIISELQEEELYVIRKIGLEEIRHMNDILAAFINLFSEGQVKSNE